MLKYLAEASAIEASDFHRYTPYYQVGMQSHLSERERTAHYINTRTLVRRVCKTLGLTNIHKHRKESMEDRILLVYEFIKCFPNLNERPPLIASMYWQRFFEIEAVYQFRKLGIAIEAGFNDEGEYCCPNIRELTKSKTIRDFVLWMKFERWRIRNPDKELADFLNKNSSPHNLIKLRQKFLNFELMVQRMEGNYYQFYLPNRQLNTKLSTRNLTEDNFYDEDSDDSFY